MKETLVKIQFIDVREDGQHEISLEEAEKFIEDGTHGAIDCWFSFANYTTYCILKKK